MLEELKELKPLEQADLLYFIRFIIRDHVLSIRDINAIAHNTTGDPSCSVNSLIKFCMCFDLISIEEGGKCKLVPEFHGIIDNPALITDYIISNMIEKLFDYQIFRENFFTYDYLSKSYLFRNDKLPLTYAVIRNILVSLSFFQLDRKTHTTRFFINEAYESQIAKHCKKKKYTITLEQLKQELEENRIAGELAEAYVLEFERKRIDDSTINKNIKIISDIDVGAGYDIISFSSATALEYDRFIEVKALSSSGFYWSKNEVAIAKLKSNYYYLYLVDLTQINNPDYIPLMIKNPSEAIFQFDEWFVESETYHVRQVKVHSS